MESLGFRLNLLAKKSVTLVRKDFGAGQGAPLLTSHRQMSARWGSLIWSVGSEVTVPSMMKMNIQGSYWF